MAGHSKFANIKHRKGAQDKKRGKLFSRLAKEITVAAKSGMPDPEMNPRLRSAIAAARAENMPNDNIKRAVDKASGAAGEAALEEMRYEGYGPAGVAIIVETVTDNKNRTAGDVRSTFSKYGGNLGSSNSVAFMFDRVGYIYYPADAVSADDIFEAAVEAGADNAESDENGHEVICSIDNLHEVRESLAEKFGDPETAKFDWKPKTLTDVDESTAQTLFKLLDALDDLDDVQEVASNFSASDEVMEKLAG